MIQKWFLIQVQGRLCVMTPSGSIILTVCTVYFTLLWHLLKVAQHQTPVSQDDVCLSVMIKQDFSPPFTFGLPYQRGYTGNSCVYLFWRCCTTHRAGVCCLLQCPGAAPCSCWVRTPRPAYLCPGTAGHKTQKLLQPHKRWDWTATSGKTCTGTAVQQLQ